MSIGVKWGSLKAYVLSDLDPPVGMGGLSHILAAAFQEAWAEAARLLMDLTWQIQGSFFCHLLLVKQVTEAGPDARRGCFSQPGLL